MTYDDEQSDWIFPSGARTYAHSDTLGIDTEGEVSYGWDGGLDLPADLPASDHIEMADMMIARWVAYRSKFL